MTSHLGKTPVAGGSGTGKLVPKKTGAHVQVSQVSTNEPQPHKSSLSLPKLLVSKVRTSSHPNDEYFWLENDVRESGEHRVGQDTPLRKRVCDSKGNRKPTGTGQGSKGAPKDKETLRLDQKGAKFKLKHETGLWDKVQEEVRKKMEQKLSGDETKRKQELKKIDGIYFHWLMVRKYQDASGSCKFEISNISTVREIFYDLVSEQRVSRAQASRTSSGSEQSKARSEPVVTPDIDVYSAKLEAFILRRSTTLGMTKLPDN